MNPYISDLFFAHNKEQAEMWKQGNFAGYDEGELYAVAEDFREILTGLGVECPKPNELIFDFKHRL